MAVLSSRYRSIASVQDPATTESGYTFPVMRSPDAHLLLSKRVKQNSFELIVSPSEGGPRNVTVSVPGNPLQFAWNPRTDTIAFLATRPWKDGYKVFLWSFFKQQVVEQPTEVRNASFPLKWSPDGRKLLLANGSSAEADLEISSFDGLMLSHPSFVARIYPQSDYAWSPDSGYVAYVGMDRPVEVIIHSVGRPTVDRSFRGMAGDEVRDLSWTKDGSSLVMGYRSRKEEWFSLAQLSLQTNQITVCPSFGGDVTQPQFLSDQTIALLRARATDKVINSLHCEVRQNTPALGVGAHLMRMGSSVASYDIMAKTSDGPPTLLAATVDSLHVSTVARPSVVGSTLSIPSPPPREQSLLMNGRTVHFWTRTPPTGVSLKGIVIWLHGGPHLYESAEWSPIYEEMGRRGFVVLTPNYSGSTTFGKVYERDGTINIRTDEIVGIAQWAKNEWPADATNIILVGESYGAPLASAVLQADPNLCRRVLYVSAIPPLVPNAFQGEIDIFHGTADPVSSPWKMLWSLTGTQSARPLADLKLKLFILTHEGHGLSHLRSQLAVADAATE